MRTSVLKGAKVLVFGQEEAAHNKTQVVVKRNSRRIVCTLFANGKRHDCRLFKESKVRVKPETEVDTDRGNQGIGGIPAKSVLPGKKSGKHSLLPADEVFNQLV